jgi:futalosine hydrolase
MRVLIVAATSIEIAPLRARLDDGRVPAAGGGKVAPDERLIAYAFRNHDVDVLVTGVGMVATAAWTARVLADTRYDFALNLGVCGSFSQTLPLGGVVHVVSDRIAELGAEDGDRFLPIDELGLPTDYQFTSGPIPDNAALRRLPAVNGITVNTVHGNEQTIDLVRRRCAPQVESMEGAAFMYACLIHQMPFAEIRAVSNVVERRNRGAWKMKEAIDNLNATALKLLDQA